MNLIKRLESETPQFINLQEVDEENVLCYIVAKSKKTESLFIRIVLKDNAYSVSFLAKSQETLFKEGEEVIPSGITSNGIILWSKRPKKIKK